MNRRTLLLTLVVFGGFGLSVRSAQDAGPSHSAAQSDAAGAAPVTSSEQSVQPVNPSVGPQQPSGVVPCTPAPALSPASIEAGVRLLLKKQVADWNRGDVAAFMRGYWKSPQTEFVSADGIMRGWQTVLDRYRKAYPDRASMGHLDFSALEVTVLGPEAALAVGHWQLKRQNDTPGGAFTLVFKKFPEGWRIINDHTSQNP
jgi:hypothetical protein